MGCFPQIHEHRGRLTSRGLGAKVRRSRWVQYVVGSGLGLRELGLVG